MTTIGRLDPYFTSLISDLMTIERRPLSLLERQRDTISVRSTAYQSLSTRLNALQDLTQSMISTDVSFALESGRSVSIATMDNEDTVLSASVDKDAGVGDYEVSVTTLAQEQRRASAVQANIDQALGLSGTFWLGGTGAANASVTPDTTVTSVGTSALVGDLLEIGTQTYTVETRDNEGTMEFRLKDVDGNVLAIQDQDEDPGETTTHWQTINAGAYDTGRGLTITFGASPSAGTTDIDYTAAGVGVTVSATDSLLEIANLINEADQPTGRDAHATVVGTQLVLTAENTGTAHTMIYTDSVGLGFGADIQTATNASFSVNDIAFTRSSNVVTDVINDVTLTFAADAEGKTADMTIAADMAGARGTIESFISKFNETLVYIEEQTAVVSLSAGSYSRGTLANESVFSDLRSSLLNKLMSNLDIGGEFDNLREIGIIIDDNLRATIDDSDALDDALINNFDDTTQLFDSLMQEVDTMLGRFTGVSGYLNSAKESLETQLTDVNSDIDNMVTRLNEKQTSLIYQYAQLQSQMYQMQYTQQIMNSINRFV